MRRATSPPYCKLQTVEKIKFKTYDKHFKEKNR